MDDITHVRIKNTNMVREMSSQAVLSTNRSELTRYHAARKQKLEEKTQTDARFHKLEQELETLKSIVRELIDVKSN